MDDKTKELRRHHITGTDISAICGFNPYKSGSDVWLEKKNLVEQDIDNKFTRWGKCLEDVIAIRYCEETKHDLVKSDFIIKDIFAGTPDRLCLDDKNLGVEIKNAGWRQLSKYGDPGTDQVPDHYLLQCAWYMMLTNRDRWDLAVLIGGNDFRIYTIMKNKKLEEKLVSTAKFWWDEYIIGDKMPELSASKIAEQYLKKFYLRSNERIIDPTDDHIELAKKYSELRDSLSSLEAEKEDIEVKLKLAVGENAGMKNDLFTFTWKKTKDNQKVNWQSIAEELKAPIELIEKHTVINEGQRRIYFKSNFKE